MNNKIFRLFSLIYLAILQIAIMAFAISEYQISLEYEFLNMSIAEMIYSVCLLCVMEMAWLYIVYISLKDE